MKILFYRFATVYKVNACFLLLWLCVCTSCKKNNVVDEHPQYFNIFVKYADSTYNLPANKSDALIDSVFNSIPDPGQGDIFVEDSLKRNHHHFIQLADLNKWLVLTDRMLLICKNRLNEEKYAERYARTLYTKEDCLARAGKYYEGFHALTLAEETKFRFVKNKCSLINFESNLPNLVFSQKNYLLAAQLFLKEFENCKFDCDSNTLNNIMRQHSAMRDAGESYTMAGNADSASFYLYAALNLIKKIEIKFPSARGYINIATGVIYADMADVSSLKGDFKEGEQLYKKSMVLAASDPGSNGHQETKEKLARLYLTNKENKPGGDLLKELKVLLGVRANENTFINFYKLSVMYYRNVMQFDSAFYFQQKYMSFKDSVEQKDKKFAQVNIDKEFENLELKYNNEILLREAKIKNLYLFIILLIFSTVTAIAVFEWNHLKRIRKLNGRLQQKNNDMQRAFSLLEHSHNENTRITRILAHDLKTPISTINNLVHSLLKKECPADLKEICMLIKTTCGNSMVLISEGLNQKKNTFVARKDLVDMKRLIEYCVDLLQPKADEKKQLITLYAENAVLLLNSQKMWRVISNIVNNAIKFSPEFAEIDINLLKKESSVLLSVHDKGIGIPKNIKDKIFSVSPEVSRPGTFGEESYGLGLSISQKIVEEHKGKIWFDSIDGEGSVFYVELPFLN